jgi:hypothetical protein
MGCAIKDGLWLWAVQQKTACDYGLCNRRRLVTMGCATEDGFWLWAVQQKTACDYGLCNTRRLVTMGCVTEDGLWLYACIIYSCRSKDTQFSSTYTDGSSVRKLCHLEDEMQLIQCLNREWTKEIEGREDKDKWLTAQYNRKHLSHQFISSSQHTARISYISIT